MKKMLSILLAAIMILGLAACNKPETPQGSSDAGTTAPASQAPETKAPETQPGSTAPETAPSLTEPDDHTAQEDRYGGELAYSYKNGVSTVLDGCKKTGNSVYNWSFWTFENPLALDSEGNIQPKVCNYEYDEATATLKLWPRENTFFSNGDAVDIDDVFASVDRSIHLVKQPKTNILDKIVKDPEIITDTDGIKKMVIVWPEHASTNLQYISCYQPWCPIMPKEIIEKYGYDGSIVDPADCIATGPYKVVEFEPGVSVTLKPNDYYVPNENGLKGLAGPM